MKMVMLILLLVVTVKGDDHLSALLIKQAGDSILSAPFSQSEPQYHPMVRMELPSPEDLLIRRLQGELAMRVDDNWLSLNDPQRWALMQNKPDGPARQILKSFAQIKNSSFKLEQIVDVEGVEQILNSLQLSSRERQTWVPYWESIRREVGQIAQIYNIFKGYIENANNITENTLQDFATSVTQSRISGRDSLQTMLDNFHLTVCPNDSSNRQLFPYLHSLIEEGEHLCTMTQSPNQLMYNLYNIIALTEIKGYAMLQFSYMMLKIYDKGNFTVEADSAKTKFESQATEKINSVKMILPSMSRKYLRCDPNQHREGETFFQVTKLLQGYIENEVDMNPSQSCKSQCNSYSYAESTSCFKDYFCAKQPRCNGRIFDCQFYNADAWVCMAENAGTRRYDWIEYENGVILGEKSTCINKIKVDSWWRYIFWHCSYCLCKCDEITEDSHRFWSLLPAVSDIANNKVVTGVKFTKIGRIIYPQVEEASTLPEGGIDETTKVWVAPTEIAFSDLTNLTMNTRQVFTMSYEQRAMDMDQLQAPEGHVLTGVKFRALGGHLNLEIQVTPITFQSGELMTDRYTWIANDNTPATTRPRELVPIIMPDIPTKLRGQNEVGTTTDEFIQFDATSAHKDVAQTTIPFIDAQPVSPQPATWLSGAGLYHKGQVGYGGFVGFSVSSYDFARHLVPGGEPPVLRYQFVKAEEV